MVNKRFSKTTTYAH